MFSSWDSLNVYGDSSLFLLQFSVRNVCTVTSLGDTAVYIQPICPCKCSTCPYGLNVGNN